MDPTRFDDLVRSLDRPASRRATLAALVGSAAASALDHPATVARHKRHGSACRQLAPAAVVVGDFFVFSKCMAPAECRNGSKATIQAGGQALCQGADQTTTCATQSADCGPSPQQCVPLFDPANSAANLNTAACTAGTQCGTTAQTQCQCRLDPPGAKVACKCGCQPVTT
jgi:hypothetical protein